MTKVSIQGQPGSFHDIARKQYFKNGRELVCRDTFKQVFKDVDSGTADLAVVAIENSLYGSINEVYDLLLKYKFWINGEVYLRIEHFLLGLPGASIKNLREVHSHPLALAQCEAYLDKTLPYVERFEHHDTAGSAVDVTNWQDPTKAAIASKQAGKLNDLSILAKNIETNKQNYTRFIVLSKDEKHKPNADKTSIVLETAHKPGALYKALGVFTDNNINLTKLESRPIIGKAWHYIFYVDFEAGIDDKSTVNTLKKLNETGNQVIVLGSYHRGRMPNN